MSFFEWIHFLEYFFNIPFLSTFWSDFSSLNAFLSTFYSNCIVFYFFKYFFEWLQFFCTFLRLFLTQNPYGIVYLTLSKYFLNPCYKLWAWLPNVQEDQPGSKYCFTRGDMKVECQGDMVSYSHMVTWWVLVTWWHYDIGSWWLLVTWRHHD